MSYHNQDGLYGVYAKTAFYRNWIDTNIQANGGASYCPETELDLTGIADP